MGRLLHALGYNWKLKLLAFTLALLLWVVVSADQLITQWLPVVLEVETQDARWQLEPASVPEQVQVRFVGPAREIWDLALDRPRLYLRVTEVEDSLHRVVLEPQFVRLPTGMSADPRDVRPGSLLLRFQRLATREVPVRVAVERGSAERYALAESVQVQPLRVRVTGPAAALARVDTLRTIPLDLTRVDSTFRRRLRLQGTDARGLRFATDEVTVSGRVEVVGERVLPAVPVTLDAGLRAEPGAVEVRLRGPRRALQRLAADSVRVYLTAAALPALDPAGTVVPLRVQGVPPQIRASAVPSAVRLFGPGAGSAPDTARSAGLAP